MTRIQANLLLTLIAMIWGSAFVAQAHGMESIGPMMFTGIRFLIGALVVLPLIVRERRAPGATVLRGSDALKIMGLGALLTTGAALQQIGIQYTSVTNAGFLTALYVPLVPLLGWLVLKHLPHWSVWPGALACLVGAFLLSGAHELNIGAGDAWVIASSLPWAVHVLLVGMVADRMNAPFTVAGGQFLFCGVAALSGRCSSNRGAGPASRPPPGPSSTPACCRWAWPSPARSSRSATRTRRTPRSSCRPRRCSPPSSVT